MQRSMADVDPPRFAIREVRPDEFEALGELTVRAYAAIPGETDDGYHASLRDVARRAAVEARPAATVVLLRPGPAGLEALLTHRPSTMAFAPDMHVFPGGRVDPADADPSLAVRSVRTPAEAAGAMGGDLPPGVALVAHVAAIRELFEEAGVLLADTSAPAALISAGRSALLRGETSLPSLARDLDLWLRTDLLVPLSRWVTPAGYPRRFDARFFVAALLDGVEPSFEGDEVAAHGWLRPTDALAAMAERRLAMWLPTTTTLQQLEHVTSVDEIIEFLSPGPLGAIVVDELTPELTRIVMPAGGGVAGQPVCAYLVGRRRFVLIDPGDPTGPALDRAVELAAARGGTTEAVALTHVDPDHAAGAESLAESLAIPVLAGPGGGRPLPYTVRELADLEWLEAGDVPLRAVHAPGPRPDHLAFIVGNGEFVLAGDLDGVRGARALVGPWDDAAASASIDRLRRLALEAVWLSGHPAS
jgi:glyoxylase-like metal-dependent hydrolase (beta-lactamase superfamily II)/8-oxo-dGTP pyrophosphatase MutT (NUDIX family)